VRLTDKKRTNPTKDEKLAATLLQLKRFNEAGELVPLIDREQAKGMSASELISCVDFDHWPVAVSLGGTNHPTNLVPKLRADHKKKTATKDAKINAKLRRILAKEKEKSDKLSSFYRNTRPAPDTAASPKTAVEKKKRQIMGSKSTPFKKKLNGKTEIRK